ncbi:MAG: enoyl-CoA hydratase/isomerase family protein, partial [Rhodobacteraceae bacterium]|nr:enoyl-CoA hydratase/isomerase family protein [Paracoccaceae bacterium]
MIDRSPVALTRHGTVAVITVDHPPVNAINHAVRSGLMAALREIEGDPGIKAAVIAASGRTFMAGSDIREFDSAPREPVLKDVVAAVESLSIPVVAAIHGTALGGGLELAMGCHYRVATVNAKAGQPEIALGLIPGAGGTQRLPR